MKLPSVDPEGAEMVLNSTRFPFLFPDDRLSQVIKEIQESQTNCSLLLMKSMNKLLQILQLPENTTFTSDKDATIDRDSSDDTFAVLYIVFVLLFFATSLVVVLVRYLLRQRESHRLETFYSNYLQKKQPRTVLFDRKGRRLTDPQVWYEETKGDEMIQMQKKKIVRFKDSKAKKGSIKRQRVPGLTVSKLANGISLSSLGTKQSQGLNRHTDVANKK